MCILMMKNRHGQTPADNSYWDVITTGFNSVGVYSHGTAYKTGDTVQYGGNSYVCILDAQNQRLKMQMEQIIQLIGKSSWWF